VGGGKAVTAENIVGLVLAVLVLIYMILALVFPEKF
jgi:K+-transporting ATPase KdpF subunit